MNVRHVFVSAADRPTADNGSSRATLRTLGLALALGLCLIAGAWSPASAQTQTRVLLDLDDDSSTGCTVATADGNFDGVEQLLTTTLGVGVVDSVERQECTDPATDTFGAPITVDTPVAPPWPVGDGLGIGGGDVVETYFPLPAGECQRIRLGFEAIGGAGTDALLSTDGTFGGAPIVVDCRTILEIPTLSPQLLLVLALGLGAAALILLRRRRSAAGVIAAAFLATVAVGTAWAMVTLDGDPADWDTIPAVPATDPSADAPAGADLFAAFASVDLPAGLLFLRTDLDGNATPVAQPDAFLFFEDTQGAGDVLADNGSGADNDPDGGALTVVEINAAAFADGAPLALPSGATLTPNSDGTFTYDPVAGTSGGDAFDYTIEDNGGLQASATATITVDAVNDAPSFTIGPDQSVNEDSGAQAVSPWATALDDGDGGGQTLSFNITNNTNAALFSAGPTVDASGDLSYTPAANASGTATITVEIMDDGGTANGGVDTSPTQDFTITVNSVNDAPSFTIGPNQTVAEDSGAQVVNPWATAVDDGDGGGQTLSFNVTNNTNAALFSAGPAVSAAGVLSYTPAAGASGAATITVELMDDGGTANGGVDTSPTQDFTITVNSVNDAPSFTIGPNQSVAEDAGAQIIDPWATALDDGDGGGQTLSFNITNNTNPGLFSAGPAISPTGVLSYTPTAATSGSATITVELMDDGGTANGGVDTSPTQDFTITVNSVNDAPSFTVGPNPSVLEDAGAQVVSPWATALDDGDGGGQTLSFNITNNTNAGLFSAGPAISPAGVLSYTPAANANGSATITVELMDDGGTANGGVDTSPTQDFTITVTAVNDAPSFTLSAGAVALDEDAGAQAIAGWALTISPGPADEAGQTVGFNVTGNTVPGLFSAGPAISSTGVLSFTPSGTAVGTSMITVTLQDDGGTANGGADTSGSQNFTVTIRDVPENRAYNAIGNTELVVFPAGTASAAGVVSLEDTNSLVSTTPTLMVTGFGGSDAPLGNVTVFADGSMTYVPQAGFTGVDTFDYTVDSGRSATVSVTVADIVWYVDNQNDAQNPAGGDGRSTDPFDALTNAETPSLANHIIYVFEGDGSDTNHDVGFALGAGESLLGEGVDLVVGLETLFSGSAANRPAIGHGAGGGVTVTNADGAQIRGLEISGTTHAVQVNASVGTSTVTVADNVLTGGTSHALEAVTSGTATLNLDLGANDVESTNAAASALRAVNGGTGDLFVTNLGSTNVDPASIGRGILLDGVTFDADPSTPAIDAVSGGDLIVGTNVDPIGLSGIELNNILGEVSFGTLNSFVANGFGVKVVGAGTAAQTVISSTTGNILATGGAALDIDPLTAALTLNTVSSINSPGVGISIRDVDGSVSISSGAVNGATGTAFEVIGGNSDVNFGGGIINGTGLAVDIQGRGVNGDFVETTIGGAVSSNGAGASGIRIGGVTGDHRVTFNGTVSLGQTTALGGTGLSVDHGGDAQSEVLFTSNPLSIRTSGATGILATNAGTIGSGSVPSPLQIALDVTSGIGADVSNIGLTASFTTADVTNGAGLGMSFRNSSGLKALAGVDITTTGGVGLEVTDAGSVESSGAANVVGSTNATALRVVDAAITANDLTFRSLSSSGAIEGVVIENTGTQGGLTVTGTGAAGTGGTIQNITNNGIRLQQAESISLAYMNLTNANTSDAGGAGVCDGITNAACRAALKMQQVSDVVVDNFAINGTAEVGINGFQVTNFDLSNTTVQNAGNALNEHGIYLRDLFGRAADGDTNRFENVTVFNSNNHNIFISNNNATSTGVAASPDVVEFVNSTVRSLSAPNGTNGLLFESRDDGNLRLDVSGSTFNANRGIGLNAQAGLGALLDVDVTTSSFVNTSGAQDVGLSIGATQSSAVTFDVTNNTQFTSTASHHVNIIAFDTAQITGTVADNSNMNGSGNGSGVRAVFEGNSQGVLLIDNNTISGHDFGRGIDLQSRAGGGSLDVTVRNNTITPQGFSNDGIVAIAGNGDAGETNRLCIHYENNTSAGGAGREGYFVEQFANTTFQIQSYAGAAGNAGQVAAHLASENTSGNGRVSPAGFGVVVNYTANNCATP
ncbi:MAG: tandem-95 repeat protein [Acidobacteriota bacterium]